MRRQAFRRWLASARSERLKMARAGRFGVRPVEIESVIQAYEAELRLRG